MDTESRHDSTSLSTYLEVLKRRIWIVLIPIVLVPVAAHFYSARQTPVYSASSEVLLSRNNLASALTGVPDTAGLDGWSAVETEMSLAQVPAIAERTLKTLPKLGMTPGELLGKTSVTQKGTSDILLFTVRDTSPARAATLATHVRRRVHEVPT